jgi:hypothetical protein
MPAEADVRLTPQREVIKRFLAHMIRGWETLDVPVVLELRLLKNRQCQYRRFGLANIDAAAEWAAGQNEVGWNAHYVVNPIDMSHVGAARAAAIVGSRYVFIDVDAPEALAITEASALTSSVEVVTGTVPHRRLHRYYELAEGMVGIADWALLVAGALRHFKSDPAVKDAARAMRLPGTITWPTEKKRKRGYIPELTTVSTTEATYTVADLRNAFGPVSADTAPRQALPALRDALPDLATLASALRAIPNDSTMDDWESWNRIGMALSAATGGGEPGFQLFDEWSSRHFSYDAAATRARWTSYSGSPPDRLSAGTIFFRALQNGWRGAAHGPEPVAADHCQSRDASMNPNGNDEVAADEGEDSGGRGPKQADMLIALAEPAKLFHTPDGTGFADLDINGHRETWPIRRKDFRRWLARLFFKATGGAPSSEALQSALNVIEAKAHFDAPERQVHVRVGGLDGKLYLDLCDDAWRAVEIDANGWRVIDRPPVRFRRAAGMQPLPMPKPGGSIKQLRSFLNVASDSDFVLVVTWALAGFRDRGPYPVLVLSGEQGSAKSTFSAILRALLDPNTAPLRALPREDRDLFIAANNGHVLAFDNVSGLPAWISDTLCRLATGGGFAVRQLYTDQDEMLFEACRPVILNGIEDIVTKPDLADRALFLTLEPIPEEKRRPEAELWLAFEAVRPYILGGLLDAVVEGLKRLPETHLPKLPRMADFTMWGTACEPALWSAGTFWSAYSGNIAGSVEAVIDADPVADAVRTMMTPKSEWTGTAKELLSSLAGEAGERTAKSKSWPTTPEGLRNRLRRAATGLRKIGINVVFPGKRDRPRNICITSSISDRSRPEEKGAQLSEPSELSAATPKSNAGKDLAEPERATVIRQSDSCKDGVATVGPTVAANPLKSDASDSPDSPDSESPTHSASDKPRWSTGL